MPRKSRILGDSGIYHVMLRGINRNTIFLEGNDYHYFLTLLKRFKAKSRFKLHAYCLMPNHIHLLIESGDEPLATIFQRIGPAFVYWYNQKYQRVGHLFQDRFRSEVVDSDPYFITVLRYILQNPVKAGLCEWAEDYAFSSAREYLTGGNGITDTDFARDVLGETDIKTFLHQESEDKCLDLPAAGPFKLTDQAARQLVGEALGADYFYDPQADVPEALFPLIRDFLSAGISVRTLNKVSGIPKSLIEKAAREAE